LAERLVVDLKDMILEDLLIVFVLGVLVEEATILMKLEDIRLHATHYSVLVLADTELDFDYEVSLVDSVHQLRLIHFAERLVE
jgi:hypothetical protein